MDAHTKANTNATVQCRLMRQDGFHGCICQVEFARTQQFIGHHGTAAINAQNALEKLRIGPRQYHRFTVSLPEAFGPTGEWQKNWSTFLP